MMSNFTSIPGWRSWDNGGMGSSIRDGQGWHTSDTVNRASCSIPRRGGWRAEKVGAAPYRPCVGVSYVRSGICHDSLLHGAAALIFRYHEAVAASAAEWRCVGLVCCFFFNVTATTEIYTLSLHDALPIWLLRLDALHRRGPLSRLLQSGR